MNEFEFTAPATSPAAPLATASIPPETPFAPEPALPVAQAPATEPEPCLDVSVYPESITHGGDNDQGQAIFDIVLTVSWTANNNYQTAKVVKSIALDKQAILQQVLNGTPVTVVESKKEKSNDTLIRMRELAGIPGKGTFVN